MGERVLIISDKKRDVDLFEKIPGSKGFEIEGISLFEKIEDMILKDTFAAILECPLPGSSKMGKRRRNLSTGLTPGP